MLTHFLLQKFYLVVKLVESTSVDTLVGNLKQNCFESSEKIQKRSMSFHFFTPDGHFHFLYSASFYFRR